MGALVLPGCPPLSRIVSPGSLPCSACSRLEIGRVVRSLPEMEATALVRADPLLRAVSHDYYVVQLFIVLREDDLQRTVAGLHFLLVESDEGEHQRRVALRDAERKPAVGVGGSASLAAFNRYGHSRHRISLFVLHPSGDIATGLRKCEGGREEA